MPRKEIRIRAYELELWDEFLWYNCWYKVIKIEEGRIYYRPVSCSLPLTNYQQMESMSQGSQQFFDVIKEKE